MYDYRGIDGTGTASSPATGSNQVSYVIRKLADGNCWMSENLKLTLSTSHSYEVATFSGGTASWIPNEDILSDSPYNIAISKNTIADDATTGEWYYPWYAATAGQGTNDVNPTISQSICPKGWKLPNGGTDAAPSFQSLATTYSIGNNAAGSTKLQSTPLSFHIAGYYATSGLLNSSTVGIYWSASPYVGNNKTAYSLELGGVSANFQYTAIYKPNGFTVRCVTIL